MSRNQIVIRLILLVAAITGLGLFASQRISFDTDPLEMLPEDLPEATGLQLFQKRFG
ncbi:MAG: putative RND superfamily exporter protein, partial [Verrucomicrobiales bacterium]